MSEMVNSEVLDFLKNVKVIVKTEACYYYINKDPRREDSQAIRFNSEEEAVIGLFGSKSVVKGKDYIVFKGSGWESLIYITEPTDEYIDIYYFNMNDKVIKTNKTFTIYVPWETAGPDEHMSGRYRMAGYRVFKDKNFIPLYSNITNKLFTTKEAFTTYSGKRGIKEYCYGDEQAENMTEDIKRTRSNILSCKLYHDDCSSDVTLGDLRNGYGSWYSAMLKLSQQSCNRIEKFFGNERSWEKFMNNNEMKTMADFKNYMNFTAYKEPTDKALTTLNKVCDLANEATWVENGYVFDRNVDKIIITLYKKSSWENQHLLLIYDTKLKKRYVYIFDKDLKYVSQPIASIQYIESNFCALNYYNNSGYYDSKYHWISVKEKNEKYIKPTWIKPIKEIFKGTNLEILMNHYTSDMKFRISCGTYRDREFDTLTKNVSEEYFSNGIFRYFIDPRPITEQLIKSELFELYLICIDDFYGSKRIFQYDSLEKANNLYQLRNSFMVINKKGKNLKEIFGMTMNQLRYLNSIIKNYYTEKDKDMDYWIMPSLNRIRIEEVLGCKFNLLDETTYKEIIEESISSSTSNDYRCRDIQWSEFMQKSSVEEDSAYSLIKNYSPREKWKFINTWKRGEILNDYLKLRAELRELHEQLPDKIEFTEKMYPILPQKAKVFARFTEGKTNWNGHEISFEEQWDSINRSYTNAELVKDENGNYFGVILTMNSQEHAQYLHDEVSKWLSFYHDKNNEILFEKAVERVEDLEYTGKELSIVAPKEMRDLQKEGGILNHCVGGFVNSIIKGTTNILFIRRNNHINMPYYTMEILNDGSIRQVHCFNNGSLTEVDQENAYKTMKESESRAEDAVVYDKTFNIIKFLGEWANVKKGKIKIDSVKTKYKALCANNN